jgi:hypothetical protein
MAAMAVLAASLFADAAHAQLPTVWGESYGYFDYTSRRVYGYSRTSAYWSGRVDVEAYLYTPAGDLEHMCSADSVQYAQCDWEYLGGENGYYEAIGDHYFENGAPAYWEYAGYSSSSFYARPVFDPAIDYITVTSGTPVRGAPITMTIYGRTWLFAVIPLRLRSTASPRTM